MLSIALLVPGTAPHPLKSSENSARADKPAGRGRSGALRAGRSPGIIRPLKARRSARREGPGFRRMGRSISTAAILVAAAAATGLTVWGWRGATGAARPAHRTPGLVADRLASTAGPAASDRAGAVSALAGRVRALETRLAAEAAQRRQLEEQVEALRSELSALGERAESAAAGPKTAAVAPPVAAAAAAGHPQGDPIDYSKSATERALVAAGIDPGTAEDIKRRGDELALAEMYLRDQAAREHWIDTPRFAEELAAIEAQRTSIRDEVGDTAYDGYLYALGRPNRVLVQDVLSQSPAEDAGLQAGDLILRYGAARIFHSEELIEQTRSGPPGETVRLDVLRNGERLEIDVPRGPLGVRIAPAQDVPEAG